MPSREAREERVMARLADERRLREELEEEYGIVGHPKASRLWEIAWDLGHAYGYDEVEAHYRELVDLLDREDTDA